MGANRLKSSRLTITIAIVSGVALLLVVALGLMLVVSYEIARRNTEELTADKSGLIIDSIVDRLRDHLDPVAAQLAHVARPLEDGTVDPSDTAALRRLMWSAMAATPQVSVVAFVTPKARVVRTFRNRPNQPVRVSDWSDDPLLRRMIERARVGKRSFWGNLFVAEPVQRTYVNRVRPVFKGERFLGILISGVSMIELSDFVRRLGETRGTRAFILLGADTVLAHAALRRGFKGLSDQHPLPGIDEVNDPVLAAPELRRAISANDLRSSGVTRHLISAGGQRFIVIVRRLDGYGGQHWYVGAYLPSTELSAQLSRLPYVPTVGLVVTVIALLGALAFGRRLSEPIRRIAAEARKVQDLNLYALAPLPRSVFRELDEVSQAFNAMTNALRRIAAYVPTSLVTRLVHEPHRGPSPPEERDVTVLFTDIVGFTALSEELKPTEVARLLNEHFSLVDECVAREGGLVDKYIGDSVMAFWGAPERHPDHAIRASRAALAIIESIENDNLRRRESGLPVVRVRIGIHSGPVVVGDIGTPVRLNYTVIGDTVNIAQRLEMLARELVDERAEAAALVSGETARQVTDRFQLEALGVHRLRGRLHSIDVHRLRGKT
jgi:adenylate cyclase